MRLINHLINFSINTFPATTVTTTMNIDLPKSRPKWSVANKATAAIIPV